MTNARYRRLVQEWLGLQRVRALMLASLRDLNEQIEDIRPELRNPPLEEFTRRLGGTQKDPGVYGRWIERYLDEALAEEIVSEDELVTA
jgi:hypothetical protein